MRILICGSRDYVDRDGVLTTMLTGFIESAECYNYEDDPLVVITGAAGGVDSLTYRWCDERELGCGCVVQQETYPARWKEYGNAAGPIRNQQMLDEGKPDLVIGFTNRPLEESRGTKDMLTRSKKAGVPTYLVQKL